jgi:mRNA interferase MazF
MVTSKLDNLKFPHDLNIEDLKSAGLPSPSVIRLSKIVTIDSSIVIKKLGRLAKNEQRLLKKEFQLLFEDLA